MDIWKNSMTYKIVMAINHFFRNLFANSMFVQGFVKEKDTSETQKNSIFVKVMNAIIHFFQKFFHKLKLDALLEASIFTKPQVWITFVLALSPFLPTMLVLALVLMSAFSLILKAFTDTSFELKYFKTNTWILAFILVVAFCALTSVSTAESIKIGMLTIAFILFYFVWINTISTKEQMRFYLSVFVIAGTVAALYGLYQYFFGDIYSQEWLDGNMFEEIKMRVYSTFANPNVFGEYLLLVIPFSIMLLIHSKGWFGRLFWLANVGILMLALVLTFSRGCWLGIIFALFVLAILIDKRLIWAGVLLLFIAPFVLPESIMARFTSIGNMADTSTSYRVYIWLGTIAMLKDYFLSGVGLGTSSFNLVYPLYAYNDIVAPHSHSLYLQLFVEYGLVGFIVFVGIIYNFYKETFIAYLKNKNYVTMASIAAITGFLVQSATDYTWYNYRVVLIFWLVIAIGISSTRNELSR
ncbi:MAG: O-antigen ligase family protein [Clostridia bacterium]|nr:O-antigen ligase family protein [Clostridia bacterium]